MTEAAALTIRLHAADNVVVARADILPGTQVPAEGVSALDHIPAGHKLTTAPIAKGEAVRKYDQIIGFAAEDLAPGRHAHVDTVELHAFERDPAPGSEAKPTRYFDAADQVSFQGIRRADGSVGTRNYLGVLSTVNCSATVARYIAEAIGADELAGFPNVDGVVPLVHATGCGMASDGEGYANLQRALWGHARHPNFAGILMVGLGCEVNQIDFLLEAYGIERGPRFQTFNIQGAGGTRRSVEKGAEILRAMLPAANEAAREPVPVSELTLAVQCGGSDAYSGITANPALGAAADILVRHGGTVILSETPEIYGAEHLLTRRAISTAVADKLLARIRWWEDYAARHGGEMNNNPTPGNKAGGLTTILEKSLGAIAKGGTTNLCGVYRYAETVDVKGLVVMDGPGYDPCALTGQVASGGNLICFTTGRGSVYGCKPVPSLKLATNSAMYHRMDEDMDINCGVVLDEGVSVAELGEQIFERMIEVASGDKTKSEALGFGGQEFVPWQIGAVM
ncbi:MAG: altronate dehydratase [Proteobacteria bacterium]|nr:altronate dehydratase [Pseudomonadota bacterium]